MSAQLIQSLIAHLPRYAEEEGDFYSVPRGQLIDALCAQHSLDRAVAENTVNLLETLLDTLAVLDTGYLQRGEWCFMSFPAQLLAMSLLTALGDKDSRFFADHFWNTQGISDDKKDRQRDVLNAIETRRVECHARHDARPIRYIYVAWAIIKLDNAVLFYQREDTKKRFDKQAGDYGLVGGRLNQRDVRAFSGDMKRCLQTLQSSNACIKEALPETLKRELHEEAGLIFDTHYTFKPWRSLKPYTQVQGSAPNHAFTEYTVAIFYVELTLEGYLFLQQKVKSDERLVWFSIEDAANGKTVDGKIAFINALVDDFAKDRAALKAELTALPDSFSSAYLFRREKYGLTLLQNTDKPLFAGVLGKEKILDMALTARQQLLLSALAAHNRGFEFESLVEDVVLHPYGWIELQDDAALQKDLIELAALFARPALSAQSEFTIENQRDIFFRLSVEPSMLYFDPRLFVYSVRQADLNSTTAKIPITITRAAITTALGVTASKSEVFIVSLNLAAGLDKLYQYSHSADNDEAKRIEDDYKKTLHRDGKFLAFGLKGLLRREAGVIKFCPGYQVIQIESSESASCFE